MDAFGVTMNGGMYFDYDDHGRVIRIKDVNVYGVLKDTSIEYDDHGNIISVINNINKHRMIYEHDENNRLIHEMRIASTNQYSKADVEVRYVYTDTYIEKTTISTLNTRIIRSDYNMRILSDEIIYPDGGGCKTEYQLNDDNHTIRTISTITKNGEVLNSFISEYPYPVG